MPKERRPRLGVYQAALTHQAPTATVAAAMTRRHDAPKAVDRLSLCIYPPDMAAKLFTLAEANALLPQLRVMLAELKDTLAELERAEAETGELEAKLRGNGHGLATEPFDRRQAARAALGRQVEAIQALGCELKDPRTGLIDFPSRRGDEIVYLCWKLDEPQVGFWHPIETGFAGRQPL